VLLRFERDGEEDEFRIVPNGEAAVKVAVILLARRDVLLPGDRLAVEKDADLSEAAKAGAKSGLTFNPWTGTVF
jgi:hypothetical protein